MHDSKNTIKTFLDSKLYIIFPVLISAYLVILYLPMISHKGTLIYVDQPMWTTITYLMKHEIIPGQKWFWNIITDKENAGFLIGSNYSLNLMILWLMSHLFNPELSVKIFLFLCVLSVVTSIYFVSTKISNPVIGIITALLSILVVFMDANTGMCYTYLSFSFALLFWLSSIKFLNGISAKYWMLLVLLTTLSIYTHPIGFISCLSIWMSLLMVAIRKRKIKPFDKMVALYFVVPFISLLLSAPQIFAILFSAADIGSQQIISSYYGALYHPSFKESLSLKTYMGSLAGIKGQVFLLFFGIAGLISVFKKKNNIRLPLISLCLVLFLLVSRFLMLSPVKPNIFYQLSINYWRFLPYLKIAWILIIGIGLGSVYNNIINLSSEKKMIGVGAKCVGIIIIVASLGVCGRNLTLNRINRSYTLTTFDQFEKKKEISSLSGWLLRNVDLKSSRVYFEDTIATYPENSKYSNNHILALAGIASNMKQIGGWAGGSDSAFVRTYAVGAGGYLFQTNDFNTLSGHTVAENLKLLNCKFIVAHSSDLKKFLANLNFLKKIAAIGDFTVFEYKNMIPAWGFKVKNEETINLKNTSSTGYNVIANGHAGELVQLSLAFHPNWRAYYKKTEIPINYNKALMQIRLPASGNQVIELRYTIDKMKPLSLLLIGLIIFTYLSFYIHTKLIERK